LQEGTFNILSDRLTVYVRARAASGGLEGLLIDDTRDPAKPSTFTAERGLITQIDGNPNVLMINGTKQSWDADKKQLSILTFERYSLDLNQFRDAPGARVLQPDERYLPDLFNPTDVGTDAVLRQRLIVEGHNRLVGPLNCLSYVAVALASLLTGELNRRGQAKRMLSAIAVMVLLQSSALGVVNLANRDLRAVPLIYLNALLPIAGGLALVRYGHWLRHRVAQDVPAGVAA
jgi:lipopolysaccharide export system permease protein